MSNIYDLGDLIRVYGTYTDEDGAAADPSAVFCGVRDPGGTVTTYQYGVDSELVQDGTGAYHLDIDGNMAGFWHYRWYATGTGQTAEEEFFYIEATKVV